MVVKKVTYKEPADYFPKEIRKEFGLGEYWKNSDQETEETDEEEMVVNCGGIKQEKLKLNSKK